jgi:hypothetical protein
MSNIDKQAVQAVADLKAGYTLGHADVAILNELARIALAGMEAEPVAQVLSSRAGNDTSTIDKALPEGTMLYAGPQPLTTSERAELENYRNAQQVVPDKLSREEYKRRFMEEDNFDDTFRGGWNACRAAMLQGAEIAESPTTMQTAPALDSSPKIAESPSGNSPVIPDCSCGTCRPVTFTDSRFVVCSECGNKRCPHANDHRNACTGSNEPGQEGSAYPAAPQQEVK